MSDLELFVVTGQAGVNALRHVPLDGMVERMIPLVAHLVAVGYDGYTPADDELRVEVTAMLLTALGEDT